LCYYPFSPSSQRQYHYHYPIYSYPSSAVRYNCKQCMRDCEALGGHSYECAPEYEMFRRTNTYGVIPRQLFAGSVRYLIYLINLARQRAGKHSLLYDQRLSRVAGAKARDMAAIGNCPAEHYSPTFGGDEGKMLQDAGITAANFGWIIYCGQPGAYYNAVSWWMNESPKLGMHHRDIILDSNYNRLGVGTAVAQDGKRYWSVIFSS